MIISNIIVEKYFVRHVNFRKGLPVTSGYPATTLYDKYSQNNM